MTSAPSQRRDLPRPTKANGEEEASTDLRLGEFQNVPTLTLSEARLLINAVLEHRAQNERDMPQATEVLNKTRAYLDVFARFKVKENIEAVERLLSAHRELESFERSQLGSLCCEGADEAKVLIPSLTNKISDPDLDELCAELSRLRGETLDGA